MKTINLQSVLLAIFTIISLNVSAITPGNVTEKKNSILNSVTNELSENETGLECWMTELFMVRHSDELFAEDEIQIENWMTTAFSITMNNKTFMDQDIQIESWMINTCNFNNDKISCDVEAEQEIEPWMYQIM